jgi:hypothetical protein
MRPFFLCLLFYSAEENGERKRGRKYHVQRRDAGTGISAFWIQVDLVVRELIKWIRS